MPKLSLEEFLSKDWNLGRMTELIYLLQDTVNGLSEGRIYQNYNSRTAAPSSANERFDVGDQVRNSLPSELGSAGSKYIILGWVCVAAGSPGTWREIRTLTGN